MSEWFELNLQPPAMGFCMTDNVRDNRKLTIDTLFVELERERFDKEVEMMDISYNVNIIPASQIDTRASWIY